MSVMAPTGSVCTERLERWAKARLPEPYELDDMYAVIEQYKPEDLPKMIESLREAENACMAAHDEVHPRLEDDQQRLEQLELRGEFHEKDLGNIEHYLRQYVQSEFCAWWRSRAVCLDEVRLRLERELEIHETAGGSD